MNDIKLKAVGNSQAIQRELNKIIRDNANPPTGKAKVPNLSILNEISTEVEEAQHDYKYIKELLTEVKLIEEIMISSITTSAASKNLDAVEYNLKMPEVGYTSKIYGSMLSEAIDYFKNTYKIAENIPDILLKALFVQGSVPHLILPESSIDTMIGAATSMESAADFNQVMRTTLGDDKTIQTKGYIGKFSKEAKRGFTFESSDHFNATSMELKDAFLCESADLNTIVIDNFDILKRPRYEEQFTSSRVAKSIASKIGTSLESSTMDVKLNPDERIKRDKERTELIAEVFKNTKGLKRIDSVPLVHHDNSADFGEPTTLLLPPGSVIPIIPPGDPKHPIGYFVINDESGKPIDTTAYVSYYKQHRTRKDAGKAVTAALRNAASVAGIASDAVGSDIRDLETLAECYGSLVDQDIIRRFENGQKRTVELGGNKAEIGRIMLARLMKNQRTILLYVPAELMVYYAFDYNDYGVGVSLIEQSKMLSVMRINTMLANALAQQRNAVGSTVLNIELSENDMEPHKSVAEIVGEHLHNRSNGMNLMSTDPLTAIRQMQRSGVQVAVSGNPNYPGTKVSITETNGQRAQVDEVFLEDQRRKWLMAFGMIPEMVDQSTSPEFAAQVYSQNAMFAKMIAGYKRELGVLCTKHVRIHTLFSSKLRTRLEEVIEENINEVTDEMKDRFKELGDDTLNNAILQDFIVNVTLVFPDLSSSTSQQVTDDYNTKRTLVEMAAKEFISKETLPDEILGKLSEHNIDVDKYRERIVASIMRAYIRENNISPQLVEIGVKDNESYLTEMFEEILEHEDSIRKTVLDFVVAQTKNISKFNELAEKTVTKVEQKIGPIVDGTTDDMGGGFGGGGGDDFSDTGAPAPETSEDGNWENAGFPEDTTTDGLDDTNPEEQTDGQNPPVNADGTQQGNPEDIDPNAPPP